jgi:hypothetical protein
MKEWDMVKFILFASLFLCVAGTGMYFYQNYDLDSLKKDRPRCRQKLTDIGQLSAEVDLRIAELARDKRQDEKLSRYIAVQANQAQISYRTSLELKPMGENRNPREGYVDRPIEIKPVSKKRFNRQQLASFIFNIENHTNRLKVTELYLDKPTPNHEQWNMNMEITERAPLEK